jgi:formate-dependent nitrite reductase cytochrome c552 subunit
VQQKSVKVIALFIMAVCALPPGSYGDGTDDPRAVRNPAPVPYTVGARADELYFYPCGDCHAYMDPNNEVRELDVEKGHPAMLEHGNGLMWCMSCHDSPDYGRLLNLLAEPIDFDNGYQVCSGCHSQKYRDWTHGAHGKRAANWSGERRLYSCVECHDPHRPSILPRAPKPPPPIRAGLDPMEPVEVDDAHDSRRPQWEQIHDR